MRGPAALLFALPFAVGCAPAGVAPSALHAGDPIELSLTPIDGPLPSDAAPAFAVGIRANGTVRALPGRYLGASVFDGAVFALAVDGSLRRFLPTESAPMQGVPVAEHVTAIPVVSPDGAHLAYVVSEDGLTGSLRVLDAMGDREITSRLGSIGALAFSPDGASVAFVGVAASGGIAGVWIADARGVEAARCLTNCALGPGDLAVATPLPAESLRVEHQRITWIDRDGVEHEVPR